jgi:plastocyanin
MQRGPRTTLGAFLAMMTLLLAACGSTAESTPADDGDGAVATASPSAEGGGDGEETGNTVSLAGGQFSPTSLTIAAGDTVTFTGTAGHTVTEGTDGTAVDDPIVDETGGADIEVTFDEPGRYNITCKIHPAMNMTITVEG